VARPVQHVEPATLLTRHQSGEYAAVWRDLVLLGAEVRKAPYKDVARAVAQETMRRAAHNVNLLVERLAKLGYRFNPPPAHGMESVNWPCTKEERQLLQACDRKRLWIPLSLRAFLEEVGWVDLVGTHPALNPLNDSGEPLFHTDPLQLSPGCEWDLQAVFEEWSGASPEEREPAGWQLGSSAEGKSDELMDELPEDLYSIQLPNAAADAPLEGEVHKISFVEYLRLSFQRGGFPGWENYEHRPEKELASLREGLLPL